MSNTGIYRGVVYDLSDPAKQGRAKLLVPAIYGNAVSGWAQPVFATSSTAVGALVWVVFENGDLNRPTWVSPSPANDGRYYTEDEIDVFLDDVETDLLGKASTVHLHDDRYYTETEVNTLLAKPHFKGRIDTATTVSLSANVPYVMVEDTHTGWNGTTKGYTTPVAGIYRVSFNYKMGISGGTPVHSIRSGSTPLFIQPDMPNVAYGGSSFTWEGRLAASAVLAVYLHLGASYTTQSDGAGVDNNFCSIDYVRP